MQASSPAMSTPFRYRAMGYGHQEWEQRKRLLQGLSRASRGLEGSLIDINSTHHISQSRHIAVSHLTEKRGTDLTHRLTRLCESNHRSMPDCRVKSSEKPIIDDASAFDFALPWPVWLCWHSFECLSRLRSRVKPNRRATHDLQHQDWSAHHL